MNGDCPKARHGHVMIAVKHSIYMHGGMAGTEIFGDLWKLTIGMDVIMYDDYFWI